MSKYSKEDIIRMVREDDVEFIRMQFTDIFGQLKNVAITASQIEKAVNDQIMIDGSSIEGFVRINESDQYLRPDLDTFAILPWRPQHGKVARLICDVHNPDGSPFAGDPRGVETRGGRPGRERAGACGMLRAGVRLPRLLPRVQAMRVLRLPGLQEGPCRLPRSSAAYGRSELTP